VDDLGAEGFALTVQVDRSIQAQRVLGYVRTALESLLEALEAQPQRSVLALPVMPAPERRRVLEEFNDTAAPYPHEQLLHELFEAQVRRTRSAAALVYEQEQLSYEELNARANQLARYLREQGVAVDTRVGLCMERSVELVVGVLGILKAGGAYVPLDPGYPPQRLRYMVQDATPAIVLTQQRLRGVLNADVRTIALDSEWPQIARLT
jgi:non-ribosomal peptide synthetase component F